MLHCKKYTEARSRASFIVHFVAIIRLDGRQSLYSGGYHAIEFAALFASDNADHTEFALAAYWSFSNRLYSLPVACLGNASMKSIDFGHLIEDK